MNTDIAWVTSWNQDLFNASGRNLIDSFFATETDGKLFIGAEDKITQEMTLEVIPPKEKTAVCNLETSPYLKTWLEHHKDIIPERLGGKAGKCSCPNPWERSEKKHVKGCHHTWFNRNASLWYRKIVTMKHACQYNLDFKFKYLIWLDSDCIFKQKVTLDFINELANDFSVVYLRGKRPVMEAGFVIYNFDKNGALFLFDLFSFYTYDFRKLIRWDDSYVIQKLIEKNNYKCRDIGGKLVGHSDVVPNSLIGNHIEHFKGTHGRKLGIMK